MKNNKSIDNYIRPESFSTLTNNAYPDEMSHGCNYDQVSSDLSCAGPESFFRGCQTLTTIFFFLTESGPASEMPLLASR